MVRQNFDGMNVQSVNERIRKFKHNVATIFFIDDKQFNLLLIELF